MRFGSTFHRPCRPCTSRKFRSTERCWSWWLTSTLAVLENNPQLHEQLANADELARLNVERHGAIRVGTAEELATLRRMFAIMGMYPVSYYDLSQAGVPVHSTAFRPIDDAALARNPFRIFTSLLRGTD